MIIVYALSILDAISEWLDQSMEMIDVYFNIFIIIFGGALLIYALRSMKGPMQSERESFPIQFKLEKRKAKAISSLQNCALIENELQKLKQKFDCHLITAEEYNFQKTELIKLI